MKFHFCLSYAVFRDLDHVLIILDELSNVYKWDVICFVAKITLFFIIISNKETDRVGELNIQDTTCS